MIFPIGDDNVQGGNRPIFSYFFLFLNIVIFGFEFSLSENDLNIFIENYGAVPVEIAIYRTHFQTLITSMFLHGGVMHLIGNMVFLWVFADNIEAKIGNFRFFIFYMLGGVIAGLVQIFISPFSEIPCVGASGAIAAVLGSYLVMFPGSKIKILFFFFWTYRISAFIFLGLWIIQQLFSGFGSLSSLAGDSGGVAFWAHIGGFIFGFLMGFYYRMTILDNNVNT
jgi:membrane associated rhomboid family serine protease